MDFLELDAEVPIVADQLSTIVEKHHDAYVTLTSSRRQKTPIQFIGDIIRCPTNPVQTVVGTPQIIIKLPEGHGLQSYDQIVVDNVFFPSSVFTNVSVVVEAETLKWSIKTADINDKSFVKDVPLNQTIVFPMEISEFSSSSDSFPDGTLDGRQTIQMKVTPSVTYFELLAFDKKWPTGMTTVRCSFVLKSIHIGGIGVEEIQANLPVDKEHGSASKTVYQVDNDRIVISTTTKALFTTQSTGGNGMYVAKILTESKGFEKPESYYQSLDRVYSNVARIRLISTEFPCSVTNVDGKSPIKYEGQSNPYLPLLSVIIPKGCYAPDQLTRAIIHAMNAQEETLVDTNGVSRRRYFKAGKKSSSFFEIEGRCLLTIPKSQFSLNTEIRRVQFTVKSHGLSNGDTVTFPDPSNALLDFPATVLSDSKGIEDLDIFQVQVTPKLLQELKDASFVDLDVPSPFRFQTSSVMDMLGFRTPTGFMSLQRADAFPLVWPHPYFELRVRPDQPVDGVTPVPLASDILLGRVRLDPEKIGGMLIDYHSNELEAVFTPPLDNLAGFNVFLVWPDGTVPDFNGVDHVFTVSIRESQRRARQGERSPTRSSKTRSEFLPWRMNAKA